jgi:hypothetical protein
MASAKPPQAKEPAPVQSTRQMLDELDALMDRMLAIPVNDVDDPEPTAPAIIRKPTVSATLTVLEPPAEGDRVRREPPPPREIFPKRVTPAASAPEAPTLPRVIAPPPFEPSRQPPEPAPEPIPEAMIPPPLSVLAPLATRAVTAPESATPLPTLIEEQEALTARPMNVCLLPLVWLNRGFDLCTWLLGPFGGWLRSPRGRYLLGLTGLALLVAGGVWLVKDWLGWAW